MKSVKLARRTFLRGLGMASVAIALPELEAMVDDRGLLYGTASGQTMPPSGAARRLFVFYTPDGTHMPAFTPASAGASYASDGSYNVNNAPAQSAALAAGLTPTLAPLDAHRDYLNVLSGLDNHAYVLSHAFGPGAHSRGTGTFGVGQPITNAGSGGASMDQVLGSAFGTATHYRSLAISDFHETEVHLSNASWSADGSPVAAIRTPQALFAQLFMGGATGSGSQMAAAALAAQRRSVLDYVLADLGRLNARVGANDRARVEQHLTAVREMERELSYATSSCTAPTLGTVDASNAGTLARVQLYMRLVTAAFQCDLTRYVTFQLENGGDGRTYPWLSLHNPSLGHHAISHLTDANGRADQATITRYEIGLFAYLLQQLRSTPDGGGANLLDNSLVLFGNEMSDGAGHDYRNIPLVLAGKAGGTTTGRHVRYPSGTPINNLYLTLLQRLGMTSLTHFGVDSTGTLGMI